MTTWQQFGYESKERLLSIFWLTLVHYRAGSGLVSRYRTACTENWAHSISRAGTFGIKLLTARSQSIANKLNNLLLLSWPKLLVFLIDSGPGRWQPQWAPALSPSQHTGPSAAITLFLDDVSRQVGRVGAVAEMVVAVRDERGERVHSVGRLHDGNFVGLQDTTTERTQKSSGSTSKEGQCPLQSCWCQQGWE